MNDLINGLFELFGGLLLITNCLRLYKDKKVSGVNLLPTVFFTAWGYWNLFYYPSLNQWMSFAGGLVVVGANTAWVLMAVWYQLKKENGVQ